MQRKFAVGQNFTNLYETLYSVISMMVPMIKGVPSSLEGDGLACDVVSSALWRGSSGNHLLVERGTMLRDATIHVL